MTTQTESEWEAEAMRLADRYRRAPLNDVSGYYQDLRAHLATRPQVPEVPEIDYKALAMYCYATLGHPQGTNGCIAFAKGAEWMRRKAIAAATGSKA